MEELEVLKPKIYSVSELNFNIRKNLETSYSDIWVEGEVSNYYFHNKRHMYFDLKDAYSKIKVVMFYENNKNLLFEIEDGLHIIIHGYISVYEKRGEYQIVALDIKPVGKGALVLAFEQLKAKLEKKGYFDKIHKKSIPVIPKKIGVITSTGGAVLKDIVSVLKRRFENFHLIVRNVNVQGPTSTEEICDALDDLCKYGEVEVIIIARGGGSLEDLWAFNTEKLADKIFTCPIPVISAIGHETDFTISDFVADARAATPSVAAEMVIINKAETVEQLNKIMNKLKALVDARFYLCRKELNFLINRRSFTKPETMLVKFWQDLDQINIKLKDNIQKIMERWRRLLADHCKLISKKDILKKIQTCKMITDNVYKRLSSNMKSSLNFKENTLKLLLKGLQDKSPVSLLNRGFSIVWRKDDDRTIRSIDEVEVGDDIRVILSDGVLFSKILNKLCKKFDLGYKNGN